ncbi:hypothetical protein [Nocardioides sp. zg-1228]|uniref:hypothetical protein n=1 Tax=Nocardioides sp. zg-1228 TaxID=2763008 RepID=UPI001642BA67|nr:hypothetical protein [Nocardioides sp. zg-1228]MBC2933044.1 hypothetical protein [Nocardioides sp. zg-1228]QSF56762.1 hypothetical protein JX575_14295 [Nocardioides sp. zg-1228]
MERADAIASELESAVIDESAQFRQFLDRLMALQKEAVKDCTARVNGDFSAGIDKLIAVSAGLISCDFVELCGRSDLERDLIKGAGLIHDAATSAQTTA